jgi:alkylation response protein AidB-like acyl-CoA dehydrogenase
LPKRYDGFEVDAVTSRLVIEALARLDGAVAWCVGIGNEGIALTAYLPDAGAEEVCSDPNVLVAGTLFPPGKAVAAADGYAVTGTWPLASGSPNATWLYGSAAIMDGETPRMTPAGAPQSGIFLMRTSTSQPARTTSRWLAERFSASTNRRPKRLLVVNVGALAPGDGDGFTGHADGEG